MKYFIVRWVIYLNLPVISNRLEHYHMYEVDDIACIYSITNGESEKNI